MYDVHFILQLYKPVIAAFLSAVNDRGSLEELEKNCVTGRFDFEESVKVSGDELTISEQCMEELKPTKNNLNDLATRASEVLGQLKHSKHL